MLEQMVIIIPSSRTLRFCNSLPPTVAQAPISLVFKKRIEFYVGVHVIIISYAILWTTAVCKNL